MCTYDERVTRHRRPFQSIAYSFFFHETEEGIEHTRKRGTVLTDRQTVSVCVLVFIEDLVGRLEALNNRGLSLRVSEMSYHSFFLSRPLRSNKAIPGLHLE